MDGMFLSGEFDHTLDSKGRVTLPARYRDYFSRGAVLVLLPGGDPCISVFHPEAWKEFDKRNIEPLSVFNNPDHMWLTRETYTNMDEVVPDRQGRVVLSAQRIKDLGLAGKVKIVGNRTHLEIWNPTTWEEAKARRRQGNA